MLAHLMVALRHPPAGWWIAMLASGIVAGWAVCDARQSWRARRLAGSSRRRLLCGLDCARSGLAFVLALALLAFGTFARRHQPGAYGVVMVIGGTAAALYVLVLVLQVRLRNQTRQG